jgi:hypothetical protein
LTTVELSASNAPPPTTQAMPLIGERDEDDVMKGRQL